MDGHRTFGCCRFQLLVFGPYGADDKTPDAIQLLHVSGMELTNLVQAHCPENKAIADIQKRDRLRPRIAGDRVSRVYHHDIPVEWGIENSL